MVFAPAGCFFEDDAKTVNLDDDIYINPAVPPGVALTAIVPQVLNAPSLTNPYITISFNMPVDPGTINYTTSIMLESPIGIGRTQGTHYNATIYDPGEGALKIYLTLDVGALGLTGGETIRIILKDDLKAKSDPPIDPPIKLYNPVVTIDVIVQN